MTKSYDIFISYKRKSLPTANNLYYRLTTRGYSTFFDLEEMGRENFNVQLLNHIENAKDVFVILEEGSLDGCKKENWEKEDWFCHEIAFALEKKKNIIPILVNDYKMPSEDFFPDKLKELSLKHAPEFNFSFFEEYLDKLIEKDYLISKPDLQEKATSVFKFYSNENCQVFKEGKLVCSLEGMSDEPYYLPVPRKGDYRFKAVNNTSKDVQILNAAIDAIEEKSIEIKWRILNIHNLFDRKNKGCSTISIALLLAVVFIPIVLQKAPTSPKSVPLPTIDVKNSKNFDMGTESDENREDSAYREDYVNDSEYEYRRAIKEKDEYVELNINETVDLGLSVKWASHNLGANLPEEAGGYYAWGEFEEKDEYTIETYAYTYKEYGHTETRKIASNISGTKYDVATKKLGNGYRIPTKEEMKELIRDCTWTNKVFNGVRGFVVTGKTGNSIFIPCVGCKHNMSNNGVSYYWTSTADEYGYPYSLSISAYGGADGKVDLINHVSVDHGLPIRAVSGNK